MNRDKNMFSRIKDAVFNRSSGKVGELSSRAAYGQGVYTQMFGKMVPRSFQPELIEGLREALPILDAMIDRLVAIDGVPVVTGEDAALVDEITLWAKEVQVNDLQNGLTSFAHAMRGEVHEQGFNIPEYVYAADGRDVIRLNVPDSKALRAARNKDGDLQWFYNPKLNTSQQSAAQNVLEQRQSASVNASFYQDKVFKPLHMSNKCYMAYSVENNDPYGVSRLRSMPFVAKALLTIQNGVTNTHERFGDPSYHLSYKVGARVDATELEKRRTNLAQELSNTIQDKRMGKSVEFTTAVDKDSDVEIKVIGADGQVLDIEAPARHLLEQVVAKSGLPAWMLGLHFSTAERLAKFQSEILKQESDTRTSLEAETLETIVSAMLRARGHTWSDETVLLENGKRVRKAWRIEHLKPNLSDLVAEAQAKFMNAQADAVLANASLNDAQGVPVGIGGVTEPSKLSNSIIQAVHTSTRQGIKALKTINLETRPIDNPALDKVEQDMLQGVFSTWDDTIDQVLINLGIESTAPSSGMTTEGFTFTTADKAMITNEITSFIADITENEGLAQGALAQAFVRAWAQGVMDAYLRTGQLIPSGELSNASAIDALLTSTTQTISAFANDKLAPRLYAILEAGVSAGENPINIAQKLRASMDGAKWKWEQIARSETALAWDEAKRGEWQAEIADGVIDDLFDFMPAPDGCPQCQAQATGNPRILEKTPKPVQDTHPSCRCDVAPHI